MAHSIWGFGGRCHSHHHLDYMINSSFRGQVLGQLFEHHIWELIQDLFNAIRGNHQVDSFLGFILIQHPHHTQHAVTSHTFFFPGFSQQKVDGWSTPQGTSCAFTHTVPLLDGILTSLLCPSMSTLFRMMKSIPKTQSIPPKVETSKSTFPLQFPNWRGTSFACDIVGWGTPSAKCTSMGALSSSNLHHYAFVENKTWFQFFLNCPSLQSNLHIITKGFNQTPFFVK